VNIWPNGGLRDQVCNLAYELAAIAYCLPAFIQVTRVKSRNGFATDENKL